MPRSSDELRRALANQIRLMLASCASYDAGTKIEALRLATSVYTIVHDSRSIVSILTQMNIKHQMLFMATGRDVTAEELQIAHRFTPLVEFERYPNQPTGSRAPEFVPVSTFFKNRGMNSDVKELLFEKWWGDEIIFFHGHLALTRKRLVFILRNQEGGGHLDPDVGDENYLELRRPFYMFTSGLGFGVMADLELATMRQIAEELLLSLRIHKWRQQIRGRS